MSIDLNCSLCNHKFTDAELDEAYSGETDAKSDQGLGLITWYRCPDCGALTGLDE